MNRETRPWSLETLKPPWGTAKPLYEILVENPGVPLPDEEPGERIKWAPGALDGVLGHEAARGDASDVVGRVVDSLRVLLSKSTDSNFRRLYGGLRKTRLLVCVDQLLPAIKNAFPSERPRLAAVARYFAGRAPHREPVKFGIALLGITGSESDVDVLRRLGACDEFTLFAAVAIRNLSPAHERDLWELAKTVDGWGRIHVVEQLADAEDHEIRAWLLREGFRNAILDQYTACICARAGKLHEALRAGAKDPGLLNSATDLLLAMTSGGAVGGLDHYEDAAEAVEAYLDAVWVQDNCTPRYFVATDDIRDWLTSADGWERRTKCGWTPANRERCLVICQELLKKPEWKAEALKDLASPDASLFHWANTAARRLGVDTWDVLFARVQTAPISSTWWYEFTVATDGSRIDRVVEFAESALPLTEIASGPADEIGLGPGFEAHGTLDWMLQLLERFPERGWKLIRAGLQSPVVRNRHWSLRVFSNWRRDEWPEDAWEVLRAAATAEPDEQLRKDLRACLESPGGQVLKAQPKLPFDIPRGWLR